MINLLSTHRLLESRHASLVVTLFLLSTLLGCGTGDGRTTLNAQIVKQPQGGDFVSTADAEFSVDRSFEDQSGLLESSASPEEVEVRVQWVFQPRDLSGEEVVSDGRLTISSNDRQTFRASHSAGPGFVLTNYYFLRLTWQDDDGNKRVESQKAFFTVPDGSADTPSSVKEYSFHK